MDADASSLTSLKVGDRVTAVFPDIGGGHDLVLSGRVAYIELHPVQVGVPWAEYLDGDPPSIVMSWEKWLDGLDESHEAQTLTVWIGCERIWIVPADLDDAEPPAPDVRGAARRELLPAPPAAEAAQPEARERLGGAAVGAQGDGDDRRALRALRLDARRAGAPRPAAGSGRAPIRAGRAALRSMSFRAPSDQSANSVRTAAAKSVNPAYASLPASRTTTARRASSRLSSPAASDPRLKSLAAASNVRKTAWSSGESE